MKRQMGFRLFTTRNWACFATHDLPRANSNRRAFPYHHRRRRTSSIMLLNRQKSECERSRSGRRKWIAAPTLIQSREDDMSAIFGETLTFGQAKGPEVILKVFGDEHYARYEDLRGYTTVYDDELGLFCYARL